MRSDGNGFAQSLRAPKRWLIALDLIGKVAVYAPVASDAGRDDLDRVRAQGSKR
jgi:hypothetical protein